MTLMQSQSPDFPMTVQMQDPQTLVFPPCNLGGLSICQLPSMSTVSFTGDVGDSIILPFLEIRFNFPSSALNLYQALVIFSSNRLCLRDHPCSCGVTSDFYSNKIKIFTSSMELWGQAELQAHVPECLWHTSVHMSPLAPQSPRRTSVSPTCHSL